MRWRLIKGEFSRRCPVQFRGDRSRSRLKKGEQAVWQGWFWEHEIRGDRDFANHVYYTLFFRCVMDMWRLRRICRIRVLYGMRGMDVIRWIGGRGSGWSLMRMWVMSKVMRKLRSCVGWEERSETQQGGV